MIYPKKLSTNDIIKIISPSDGVREEKLEKYYQSIKKLEDYGFKITEDKYVRNSINGVSANETNRANELNESIIDKNNKALIACSGGDFLIQILNLIKFDNITKNPKWIQGFSDITTLLYYITTKYDIATIYSFNVKTFGDKYVPKEMLENNIKFLKGKTPIQKEYGYTIDETTKINLPWKCLTEFVPVTGRIIGGCLPCLKDIIGTKYDTTQQFIEKYKKDGIIWYFDIVEMTNEDVLRTLWQLKQLNWFKYCKAILISRIKDQVTYINTNIEDAIIYNLKDLNIPIIINVDIGHSDPILTIINGSIIKITKNNSYIIETIYK